MKVTIKCVNISIICDKLPRSTLGRCESQLPSSIVSQIHLNIETICSMTNNSNNEY